MGRKKLTMKKIENPTSRQITYSKRKEIIIRKAHELSVLCDTDVALIMFSPSGRLTSFASKGSIEDILLRILNRPDEINRGLVSNEEYLCHRLKQLKTEGELLEKIAIIEALENQLDKLTRRQCEAQEKIRYYNPNVENINSSFEAGVFQRFLKSALERIELSRDKLLGNQHALQRPESMEVAAFDTEDAVSFTNESDTSRGQRYPATNHNHDDGTGFLTGPHLSLSFIRGKRHWNGSDEKLSGYVNWQAHGVRDV